MRSPVLNMGHVCCTDLDLRNGAMTGHQFKGISLVESQRLGKWTARAQGQRLRTVGWNCRAPDEVSIGISASRKPWPPAWSEGLRLPNAGRNVGAFSLAVEPGASDGKGGPQSVDGSILTGDGSQLQNTLRLVECAMLAATAGLAFFLSNLLRLEGYLGCFFPLPVVISSMRWGASAGRKTMVATTLLLLVLSGPLKAASYVLMHGCVGLAIGALWRWQVNWFLSLGVCTVVRCFGALGFVSLSSWLLRENLLVLITINAHASVSYMLAAVGINIIPTMLMIYFIFAALLLLNCASFVFLLHVLYVILLKRLSIETRISAPRWIERAV